MKIADIETRLRDLLEARNFGGIKTLLDEFPAIDLAESFCDLPGDTLVRIFRLLPKEKAADVFVELDTPEKERLIAGFTDSELKGVLAEMYDDDTADLLEEMPANVVKRLVAAIPKEDREAVNQLLRYPAYSAGSLMTTRFIRLREQMRVGEGLAHVRREAADAENVSVLYVTDAKSHLIGIVELNALLAARDDWPLSNIIEPDIIHAHTLDDQEEVARSFERYDLSALPVVDNEDRLVGIITSDDIIDVFLEEADDDLAKISAVTPGDTPYLREKTWRTFRNRIPWLALMMLSSTFTSMIITHFESALSAVAVLAAFIPMLMGTAGNAGAQASGTVLRGLSTGDLEPRDVLSVFGKESKVALACALAMATFTFVKLFFFDRLVLGTAELTAAVCFAIALTMAAVIFFSKLLGAFLPIAAQKCGLDPAVMASPVLTTVVDIFSLLCYFVITGAILGL